MKKSFNIFQVALVVAAAVAVFGLYFFGQTIQSNKKDVELAENHAHSENAIDINDFRTSAITELTAEEKEQFEAAQSSGNVPLMVAFWSSIDRNDVAATYQGDVALAKDDATNWNSAGDLYVRAYRETKDSTKSVYFVEQAVSSYNSAIADGADVETKLKLAKLHTEVTGDVMQGVVLLREIVADDPNHIQANYEMGLLSIRSGQLDKAIERFNTVIQEKPDFIEPYLIKAQLLAEAGNSDEALQTINAAISNSQNAKEVDLLEQFKNKIINN